MHIFTAEKGIKDLEDEIKQLQERAVEEEPKEEKPKSDAFIQTPSTPEEQPLDKEEETWKKRHGDLRRHAQKQEQTLKDEISQLRQTVDELRNRPMGEDPPTNPDEVKAWVEKYPQVASIISALAEDKAKKLYGSEIETIKQETAKEKKSRELSRIYKAHEDFDEIKENDDFHNWAESQPQFIQDFIYKGSADQVIWALNSYKESKEPKVNLDKEAAKAVGKSTKTEPATSDGKRRFLESEIEEMSANEYMELEEEINLAAREGRVVYDISGAAR